MIELPEAVVAARQLNNTIGGKIIRNVIAAKSPHKFAWYHGDPQKYEVLLMGKKIEKANAYGGWVEIKAEDMMISFCEGINLRFHKADEKPPQNHQLFLEFEDFSSISASVQMYGGLYCYKERQFTNEYFMKAKERPSPLSEQFDIKYFQGMFYEPEISKLSVKAFIATNQRIPGLGNGVLQDILFNANIHPKKKINTFTKNENMALFEAIKSTLEEMAALGGRDTEKDLFDNPGGYKTKAGKNTVGKRCPKCSEIIKKEAYMGGSIYYCPGCQKL